MTSFGQLSAGTSGSAFLSDNSPGDNAKIRGPSYKTRRSKRYVRSRQMVQPLRGSGRHRLFLTRSERMWRRRFLSLRYAGSNSSRNVERPRRTYSAASQGATVYLGRGLVGDAA